MIRFVWRPLVISLAVVGFAGCGGGGDLTEGMPEKTEYRVPDMPDSMKPGNMTPKVLPKAGTPGSATPAPATK